RRPPCRRPRPPPGPPAPGRRPWRRWHRGRRTSRVSGSRSPSARPRRLQRPVHRSGATRSSLADVGVVESANKTEAKGTGHMAQTTVEGIEGVQSLVGKQLGYSDWVEITQEQVNQFADATGDHQWIHVDPERAKKESPFGGPIAHGYLTLSLIPSLMPQIIEITGFRMGVNYGTEKVRFPSPVAVRSRGRAAAHA